jgi:hypothetical protein
MLSNSKFRWAGYVIRMKENEIIEEYLTLSQIENGGIKERD